MTFRLFFLGPITAEATEVGGVELAEVVAVTEVDAAAPVGTAKSMV